MDLKKIETLMKLMRKYEINQVSLGDKDAGHSLRITVQPSGNMAMAYAPPPRTSPALQNPKTYEEQHSYATVHDSPKETAAKTMIRTPFVGTFYAAASAEAKPFVKIGQRIEKGDVLCIVEAMKLMNEIESDVSGTVVEILVKNETPVEYDQPLFVVE